MNAEETSRASVRAYIVGSSRERLDTLRRRLGTEGFDVCGHCDHPRDFCPPRDCELVLLITDMGSHAALQKARDYCRAHDVPCVGGLWRTWSTTRLRLAAAASSRALGCGACPNRARCARRRDGRHLR